MKVPMKTRAHSIQHCCKLLQTSCFNQSDHQSIHGKLNQDLVLLDLCKSRQARALQAWHSTAQSCPYRLATSAMTSRLSRPGAWISTTSCCTSGGAGRRAALDRLFSGSATSEGSASADSGRDRLLALTILIVHQDASKMLTQCPGPR